MWCGGGGMLEECSRTIYSSRLHIFQCVTMVQHIAHIIKLRDMHFYIVLAQRDERMRDRCKRFWIKTVLLVSGAGALFNMYRLFICINMNQCVNMCNYDVPLKLSRSATPQRQRRRRPTHNNFNKLKVLISSEIENLYTHKFTMYMKSYIMGYSNCCVTYVLICWNAFFVSLMNKLNFDIKIIVNLTVSKKRRTRCDFSN